MRKLLWTEDADHFNNTHLGCISGIFHALDYQYWHSNVKKILPHRKRSGPVKHSKRKQPLPHRRLQRTYSIHHLESNEWVHPTTFFPENVNSEEFNEKEPGQDDTNHEIDDDVDIISQTLKINRDLDGFKAYDTKAKLIKSGSFPSAYKSSSRNLRPTELKHKVNELYVSKNKKKLDNWARNSAFSNEFANKYGHLFDYSGTKEALLQCSKSLKLTNESENFMNAQASIFFRRIRSLPHLDDPNQEPHDTHFLSSASQNERNLVCTGLDSTEGTKCLNEMIYRSDISSRNEHSDCWSVELTSVGNTKSTGVSEDIFALTFQEGNHQKAQEKKQSELQISEGSESLCISEANLKNKIKNANSNRCIEQYQNDDGYFTYVRNILERSGFIKNGLQQTWYSSNQPLDPSIFQEIESRYLHDPERFEEELVELSQQLLRFDSVDEALINIYGRSFSYYPKALSCSCHLRPAPTEKLVLEEVWKSLTRLVNLKPDKNQTLDSIVSRDLGMNDGWLNLQLESECVALELEDLIFDKLLEEVLCS